MYSRTLANGKTLTFGVSSKLWRNAQVMYDRETRSLWSHLTGEAIAGPLQGMWLRPLPEATPRIRWAAWKMRYPGTKILSLEGVEDTRADIYREYRQRPDFVGYYSTETPDPRFPAKAMVIGVVVSGAARAYSSAALLRTPLRFDRIGGVPILICRDRISGATAVFQTPDEADSFRLLPGAIIGDASGKRWSAATGQPLSANAAPLIPLPHRNLYWFAWAAYYPQTTIESGEGPH